MNCSPAFVILPVAYGEPEFLPRERKVTRFSHLLIFKTPTTWEKSTKEEIYFFLPFIQGQQKTTISLKKTSMLISRRKDITGQK